MYYHSGPIWPKTALDLEQQAVCVVSCNQKVGNGLWYFAWNVQVNYLAYPV
jgi:hypothetical protein